MTALVDDADFVRVGRFTWRAIKARNGNWYAKTGKDDWLHRVILDAPAGMEVDHIDRNGLNNCRANIRLCTTSQNAVHRDFRGRSRSGFLGVRWDKDKQKWRASIMKDRRFRYAGQFDCPVEAAVARDRLAVSLFGEFAVLNFSESAGLLVDAAKRTDRGAT